MHNTNKNKKKGSLTIVSFEDICRDMAATDANAPKKRSQWALEGDETDLEEALSSIGPLIRPAPQPTPEEVKANPDSFVILDRQSLAPYFREETTAETIELLILAMLEADRIRNE